MPICLWGSQWVRFLLEEFLLSATQPTMLFPIVSSLLFASAASAVRELCGQYDVYSQKPYLCKCPKLSSPSARLTLNEGNNNVWNAVCNLLGQQSFSY